MSHERCRSCNQRIRWAVTVKGRRMPIDPVPVPDGNIELEEREVFLTPLAIVRVNIPTGEPVPPVLYKSHFATCPQAGKWRSRT